jgi:hypothetical protein
MVGLMFDWHKQQCNTLDKLLTEQRYDAHIEKDADEHRKWNQLKNKYG